MFAEGIDFDPRAGRRRQLDEGVEADPDIVEEIAVAARVGGDELDALNPRGAAVGRGAGVDVPHIVDGRRLRREQLDQRAAAVRDLEPCGLGRRAARARAVGEGPADRLAIDHADILIERAGDVGVHFGEDRPVIGGNALKTRVPQLDLARCRIPTGDRPVGVDFVVGRAGALGVVRFERGIDDDALRVRGAGQRQRRGEQGGKETHRPHRQFTVVVKVIAIAAAGASVAVVAVTLVPAKAAPWGSLSSAPVALSSSTVVAPAQLVPLRSEAGV